MTQAEADQHLLNYPDTWSEVLDDKKSIVYKVGPDQTDSSSKLFALIIDDSRPLQISLRCDLVLAENLREKYETVLPASQLNRKTWNTIICNGQLSDHDLHDLIRLSYRIATGEVSIE